MQDTQFIAIANRKGGCAKTTTAVSLFGEIVHRGGRPLLIDADPQGTATEWIGPLSPSPPATPIVSLAFLLEGGYLSDSDVQGACGGHIIPSGNLAQWERNGTPSMLFDTLQREHVEVSERWTHVLIDCPPSGGMLTRAALVACDRVLLPVEARLPALHGVPKLIAMARDAKADNPNLVIAGLLATRVDRRTRHSRQAVAMMRAAAPGLTLQTTIGENVALADAFGARLPIRQHAPKSRGCADYSRLLDELEKRHVGR